MINTPAGDEALALLAYAQSVANLARELGATNCPRPIRASEHHLGAVLADAVLQAGINYRYVVLPRVASIHARYPSAHTLFGIQEVIRAGQLADFLNWSHPLKLARFSGIVSCLQEWDIQNTEQLRQQLECELFRRRLLELNGIGPKTIDYLVCLLGGNHIAVDRHMRKFATLSGVELRNYGSLRAVFSYAADLLQLPRREFDAWVWSTVSGNVQDPEYGRFAASSMVL